MAQDKTPKRGRRWPSSTILLLLDHGSYAVLLTVDRLQLGWLTRDVDPRGWEVLTTWNYVGRVRVCFDPLKMLHYFIQNCCCITASFAASTMNSWTLTSPSLILLMLTMLPSLYLISSKQTVSSNQCLCCYTGL